MKKNEFKVMDWLRSVRDEHYEKTKDMNTEEILKENKERSSITLKEMKDRKKK